MAPPPANYAHTILTEGASRWLHTSGIVPVDLAGGTPESIADQTALVWQNINMLLVKARMRIFDVVSITTYVVVGNDLNPVMHARDVAMGRHMAASTLVTVPALAQPQWKLEISFVAAAA